MIKFLYPWMGALLFLPFMFRFLLPAIKGVYGDALQVPFIKDFAQIEERRGGVFVHSTLKNGLSRGFWALLLVWCLLALAAMRPVFVGPPLRVQNESRNLLMIVDISTSMLENDFSYQGQRLSRLNAVKSVVSGFINQRPSDRIGLILFGTRAYLQAPLTYDRKSVENILRSMDAGMAGNSTAIGDALGLGLKSIKESNQDAAKNVIILLTDGENNDGQLMLPQAIDLARQENVKVYTIGVGGGGFSLANAFFGITNSPLDEKSLKELAAETQGRYFRADDINSLVNVYREIDKLEPDKNEENFIYPRQELYYWPLLVAILLASGLMYGFRKGRA